MTQKSNGTVTLMSGGDIGPVNEPTDEFAELIAPVLRQADLRLGQCERTYSERGWVPQFAAGPGGQHSRLTPDMAGVWNKAGIDIVSLASNHAMDWGPEAMLASLVASPAPMLLATPMSAMLLITSVPWLSTVAPV